MEINNNQIPQIDTVQSNRPKLFLLLALTFLIIASGIIGWKLLIKTRLYGRKIIAGKIESVNLAENQFTLVTSQESWTVNIPKDKCFILKTTKPKQASCQEIIRPGRQVKIAYLSANLKNRQIIAIAITAAESTPKLPQASPTAAISSPPLTSLNTEFGVMLGTSLTPQKKIEIVKSLKAGFFRPRDIKVDKWNGDCPDCNAAAKAGIKLVLTLRNGGGGFTPSYFPSDLESYKRTVGQILDKYLTSIAYVVVENEENSGEIFYSGTPQEYHRELAAVCQVAHSRGLKCTNGGLVSSLVVLLTADDYRLRGNQAAADDLVKRAIPDRYNQYKAGGEMLKLQIDKGKQLIAGYKANGADYLNFHWYIADTQAMDEVVKYLKSAGGLPVLTNEIGQQNSQDPDWVTAVMSKTVELRLPLTVWFSIDVNKARALNEPDGTLRLNGESFRNFIVNQGSIGTP